MFEDHCLIHYNAINKHPYIPDFFIKGTGTPEQHIYQVNASIGIKEIKEAVFAARKEF
jgi:hypothetical protein